MEPMVPKPGEDPDEFKRRAELAAMESAYFTNILEEEWTGHYLGEPEVFKAGETKQIVRAKQRIYVKHLVDHILLRRNDSLPDDKKVSLVDEALREELENKITASPVQEEPKKEEEKKEEPKKSAPKKKEDEEEFEGLKKGKK